MMAKHTRQVRAGFHQRAVCPTCHADDEVHFIRSAVNVFRLVGNVVCGLITSLFYPWMPFRVNWQCNRCGAVFEPGPVSGERVCYRCGCSIENIPAPLRSCPVCKAPLSRPGERDGGSSDGRTTGQETE